MKKIIPDTISNCEYPFSSSSKEKPNILLSTPNKSESYVIYVMYQGKKKITQSIKKLLVENGVLFAAENMFLEIALNNQQFLGEYILRPNKSGILNGLQYLSYCSLTLSERFCADFKKILKI